MPKSTVVEALAEDVKRLTEENKRLRAQLWEVSGSTLLMYPEQLVRYGATMEQVTNVRQEARRLYTLATRHLREDEERV